jgi:uncharacterized protein (TIGR02145 family)
MDITTCTCCNGTGKIYTPAEKAAMKKAADAEKAKQAAAAEAERVRIEKAVQAASGTFTDSRDEKTYKKIAIGTQTWMKENLNYNAANSKCYENKEENCAKYGRLYDWSTAQEVCPAGMHLPSDAEWTALTDYVGGKAIAGKKLKSTNGWDNDFNGRSGNGTDEYGFSALPGGYGNSYGRFYSDGGIGNWWSIPEGNVWGRAIFAHLEDVKRGNNYEDKDNLHSVRCVQD